MKIGLVNLNEQGGRKKFITELTKTLSNEKVHVELIDLHKTSLKELRTFDILHFSSHAARGMWKLLLLPRKTKKILTVHGIIKKEIKETFPTRNLKGKLRGIISYILFHITPRFFDSLSSHSEMKSERNNHKNVTIIKNGIAPHKYKHITPKRFRSDINLVTYQNEVGLKLRSFDRMVEVMEKLNAATDKPIQLYVFGNLDTKYESPHITYLGYRNDFLEHLKGADLFLTSKSYPDLGFADLEAATLGTPIAKFYDNLEKEELTHGHNAILAKDEDEMVAKLLNYFSQPKETRKQLENNIQSFIEQEKTWNKIAQQWIAYYKSLLE